MASTSATRTPESPSTAGVSAATSIPAPTSSSRISAGARSVATNSRSQRVETLIPRPRPRPLPEEAQVVVEEEADVVDAVLEHGDSLDAHAERPASHGLGVVAHVPEHVRVHHARAEDLEPAVLLADPAPAAAAEEAEHVHLGRRLGERKEGRAEPDARPRAEHLAGEQLERALEVAHGDVGVDGEPLHLVEHGRVRDVGVAPVHLARADHPDGRGLRPSWCGSAPARYGCAGARRPTRGRCPACRAPGGRPGS